MHFSPFVFLAAIVGSISANPAPQSSDPSCLSYYQTPFVESTPGQALTIRVISSSPLTNFRNVQIRRTGTGNKRILVVDPSSPVLLVQLQDKFLFSQRLDRNNQASNDGQSGSYRNVSSTPNDALQEVFFDYFPTNAGPPKTWYLNGGGVNADYDLLHEFGFPDNDIGFGVGYGFLLCEKTGYRQIYFQFSNGRKSRTYPKCENVFLRVTYAPLLNAWDQ